MREAQPRDRCPHGRIKGDHSHLAGLAFATPFGHCRCCDQQFPYIAIGGLVEPDTTLCPDCGGQPRKINPGEGGGMVWERL